MRRRRDRSYARRRRSQCRSRDASQSGHRCAPGRSAIGVQAIEARSQSVEPLLQPPAPGAGRNAQPLGHLGRTQLFEVTKQQRRPVRLFQLSEQRRQLRMELLAFEERFGRRDRSRLDQRLMSRAPREGSGQPDLTRPSTCCRSAGSVSTSLSQSPAALRSRKVRRGGTRPTPLASLMTRSTCSAKLARPLNR